MSNLETNIYFINRYLLADINNIFFHPNWKLYPLFNHMMQVTKYVINIRQSIFVDEMDIIFQGWHKDKQRVTYKKGGDGFLVDALCAEGYTYL